MSNYEYKALKYKMKYLALQEQLYGGTLAEDAIKSIQSGQKTLIDFPNFNNDPVVVLVAVNINGMNLRHASTELKENFDVCISAINQNINALEFAGNEFIKKRKKFIEQLKEKSDVLSLYTASKFKHDKEIILLVLEKGIKLNQISTNIPSIIITNRQFALEVVNINGLNIEFLTKGKLNEDNKIIMAAIAKNPKVITKFTKPLVADKQDDLNIAMLVLTKDPSLLSDKYFAQIKKTPELFIAICKNQDIIPDDKVTLLKLLIKANPNYKSSILISKEIIACTTKAGILMDRLRSST